jgi:hypothetical protein
MMDDPKRVVVELASAMILGGVLDRVRERWGSYELLAHWTQGEFHHDVVLGVEATHELPGGALVVATNCNGGVKEVLWFDDKPDRSALWHARCPENPEFSGGLPATRALARTPHWFDPCELLAADARSEYRTEFRARQCGGGWMLKRS